MARTRTASPLDVSQLVGRGLPLPCAITLDELRRVGVPMSEHGPWLIVYAVFKTTLSKRLQRNQVSQA